MLLLKGTAALVCYKEIHLMTEAQVHELIHNNSTLIVPQCFYLLLSKLQGFLSAQVLVAKNTIFTGLEESWFPSTMSKYLMAIMWLRSYAYKEPMTYLLVATHQQLKTPHLGFLMHISPVCWHPSKNPIGDSLIVSKKLFDLCHFPCL